MSRKEELVALAIHEGNDKNEPVYFSKIVKLLKDRMTEGEVSKALDKMFDLCMIEGEWENHKGWIRALYISGSYKKYFKELYESSGGCIA